MGRSPITKAYRAYSYRAAGPITRPIAQLFVNSFPKNCEAILKEKNSFPLAIGPAAL